MEQLNEEEFSTLSMRDKITCLCDSKECLMKLTFYLKFKFLPAFVHRIVFKEIIPAYIATYHMYLTWKNRRDIQREEGALNG